MKTFTLSDLKNHTGKIVDAAIRAPVSLTKHVTEALVIMSREEFERGRDAADLRRAYGMDELPADLAGDLIASLEGVTAESYENDSPGPAERGRHPLQLTLAPGVRARRGRRAKVPFGLRRGDPAERA